jgi:peptidoglycan hydrolase-like protein with peptidoglycan-binding domain
VNVRKLILTTASILALGIGGAGVSLAAGTSNMAPYSESNMPAMSGTSAHSQTMMNLSQDEIRSAQQQLQEQGLYHGRIDGVLGPETKQALSEFQEKNGLNKTATLDQPTMDKLIGNTTGGSAGMGSSTPPTVYHGTGSTSNPQPANPPTSALGDHNAPKQ